MNRLLVPRFNSTLVRLKDCTNFIAIRPRLSFNSTLVRLKDSDGVVYPKRIAEFQFHTGSIKRATDVVH